MSKTIRVSEEFHAVIAAHHRSDETMEETLRRLVGGPDPDVLREVVAESSPEAAADVREAIERRRERDADRRSDLQERFE